MKKNDFECTRFYLDLNLFNISSASDEVKVPFNLSSLFDIILNTLLMFDPIRSKIVNELLNISFCLVMSELLFAILRHYFLMVGTLLPSLREGSLELKIDTSLGIIKAITLSMKVI